jgi:DNA repair protein RecO (recombination protein O)
MNIIKTKALVLREANFGEADKIITVLTKERGKIAISAKGARKPRSPFVAGTQQFCYCDFIVYDNKNVAILSQVEIIESFHNIRNDLFKISYAAYFMELIEKIIVEEVPSEQVLKLTLKTLQILNKTIYDPKLIARIYEFRLMELVGYMPETTQCTCCGKELEHNIYFSSEAGGILCNDCKKEFAKSIKISFGTLHTIQYILSSELSQLFKFSVSEAILQELTVISKDYISTHIDAKFKTLEFLERL